MLSFWEILSQEWQSDRKGRMVHSDTFCTLALSDFDSSGMFAGSWDFLLFPGYLTLSGVFPAFPGIFDTFWDIMGFLRSIQHSNGGSARNGSSARTGFLVTSGVPDLESPKGFLQISQNCRKVMIPRDSCFFPESDDF